MAPEPWRRILTVIATASGGRLRSAVDSKNSDYAASRFDQLLQLFLRRRLRVELSGCPDSSSRTLHSFITVLSAFGIRSKVEDIRDSE